MRCIGSFSDFVREIWPGEHGGSWARGSELIWNGESWEISSCDYECLSIAELGFLLIQYNPYELYDALLGLPDDADSSEVEKALSTVSTIKVPCYCIDNPKNSAYWSEFDGDYFDDGPGGEFVWHEMNGVMTDRDALDEWAEEVTNE